MKSFASFKILLCVVFLLFFVQSVAAEQIIVPSTDSDGVTWTAPTTGTYRFTYTGGAVRGPDTTGSICGYCLSGAPCWSNVLYFYKNREATWGGSCIEPGCCSPVNPDYSLGTGNYYTQQEAESAAKGSYFEKPLNQGDKIILLCPDFSNSPWSQNTGNYFIDVQIPVVPDISGTWNGVMSNPGQEDYSQDLIITQNGDQISGTAATVITMSNVYPQDVGKHYTYAFTGTIDETGNIHIIGDFAEGPAEILARAGHWDMNWQLSSDGNTISFHGVTGGTYIDVLLHRGTQNQPPVANAGLAQTVSVGTTVTLDGTGSSDPDNNLPLTYAWIMSAPSGSTATLSSTTAAKPTFKPDKKGDYVITLTVKDSLGLPSTVANGVTITVTNQLPEIEILSATMVSPSELGIGVNVTFPKTSPKNVARRITFEATINGKPIKKTIDVTTYTKPGIPWGKAGTPNPTVDKKGNVLPTTLLRINLADENVPRFTENINFDVIGDASYDGGPSSEKSITNAEVLLPVVLLRGWVFLAGETRTTFLDNSVAYNSFVGALRTRGYYDSNDWESNKKLPSYRTLWDPSDKETLYEDPLKTTPAQTQAKLNLLLDKYVKPHSYADKVNIVGHSFGGLVGRYFASIDPRVNTVIMVGSPHKGLTTFYEEAFNFKSEDAMAKKIKPGSMAYWAAPTYWCLYLEDGTMMDNLFQNTLVGVGQSPGVKYYSIYADTETTNEKLTIQPYGKIKSPWYYVLDHTTSNGDGSVLSTSASAFGTPIRIKSNPWAGKGWLVHVNLMNIPEVQNDAIGILANSP